MSEVDNRTASMRLEDLEKVVTMLYQGVASMKPAVESLMKSQGEMALVKDALRLLNKKTEAIIQCAASETGINVTSVSNLVIKMNVDELQAQVSGYVSNGYLTPTDEVAANSYLVCEEYNQDGTLANPRIQFRLDSQDEATSNSLLGKKVGDSVSFGENKFSAKILEIYMVTEPKLPEAAEAAPAETAPEATAPAEVVPAVTPAAPTGPDSSNYVAPPAETPVVQFVADPTTPTAASNR